MNTVDVPEADTALAELIAAAERGEPTTLRRNGKAAAVIVPLSDAERIYPEPPDFAEFLLTYPGGVELERDRTPMREIDL